MINIFFLSGISFTNIDESRGSRLKERAFKTPLYNFYLLYRHLDISRAITRGSSPLHVASDRTLS